MHVQVVAEGMQQAFVLGQVGHDPQFDLRVVGRQQFVAFWGYECLTNPATFGSTDRDVLQVRVTGGQTPGSRHRLMVGRMNPPCTRVDLLRQAIGVSALQLAHRAVLHQHLGQREVLLGQLRQHGFGRRRLALGRFADNRQTEFFVQDHTQLLG